MTAAAWVLTAAVLSGSPVEGTVDAPDPTPGVELPAAPRWAAERTLTARQRPDRAAAVRGRIAAGYAFEVFERVVATPGCAMGWGRVGPAAWACLDGAYEVAHPLRALPSLVRFDPPRPEEVDAYRRTGGWPRSDDDDGIWMPYIYGRRVGARAPGRVWPDAEAWAAGAPPVGQLADVDSEAFYAAFESRGGTVLALRDGRVVPLSEVALYAPARGYGVDLRATPAPEGRVPAWVVGASVEVLAGPGGAVVTSLSRGARVWAAPGDGGVYVVGEGVDGFVKGGRGLRWWREAPPPPEASGVWVDVDLGQQTLGLFDGPTLVFTTLVSTGKPGYATPRGVYRVTDKAGTWDMQSRPGAPEPYFVAEVPWVVHFRPRYALHAAYWHDDFGAVRSHGCVNLAPDDARVVYEALLPAAPAGWSSVGASPEAPGSVVRVR